MGDRLVLVTGATGYVGTVLTPMLAQHYPVRAFDTEAFGNAIAGTPNVEFVKGDVRDQQAVSAALENVTDVVHLAGIVTDDLVALNPEVGRQVNNDSLDLLCSQAAKSGVRRFIYASSSSIYGTHTVPGFSHLVYGCSESCEPQPMTEYARQKLMGERIVNEHKEDMRVISIRCATACGPAPRMRLDTIVNTFSAQAYFQGRITVHGGDQWRTNVHVKDVARLYRHLLEESTSYPTGSVYNLTAGNHTAIDLADIVATRFQAIIGRDVLIEVDVSQVDQRHYLMDANRLAKDLDWRPSKGLSHAVVDNIAWFDAGHVKNWQDDIYWNGRRMRATMLEGA